MSQWEEQIFNRTYLLGMKKVELVDLIEKLAGQNLDMMDYAGRLRDVIMLDLAWHDQACEPNKRCVCYGCQMGRSLLESPLVEKTN